jgi:nitroreductase
VETDAVPDAYPARPAETAVPVHPAIAARWSPSRFAANDEVGHDDLLALLEAARWAPSSGNEQPARWVAVPRAHPARAAVEEALKPGNAWAKRAALLLVSVAKTTRAKNGDRNAWAEHDVGIATGFLLVQATALGLATHPMGGWDPEALRTAVAAPDDHRPMAVIAVGHHDPALEDERLLEREARPRTRKPLGEVARFGTLDGEPVE